jgi:hypothetical protein
MYEKSLLICETNVLEMYLHSYFCDYSEFKIIVSSNFLMSHVFQDTREASRLEAAWPTAIQLTRILKTNISLFCLIIRYSSSK